MRKRCQLVNVDVGLYYSNTPQSVKKIHFFELIIMKTQQELERTSVRYIIT